MQAEFIAVAHTVAVLLVAAIAIGLVVIFSDRHLRPRWTVIWPQKSKKRRF